MEGVEWCVIVEEESALGTAAPDSVEEVSTWQAVAVRPRKGLRVGGMPWRAQNTVWLHITQDPAGPSGREAIEELEGRLSERAKTLLGMAIAAGIVLTVLIRRR